MDGSVRQFTSDDKYYCCSCNNYYEEQGIDRFYKKRKCMVMNAEVEVRVQMWILEGSRERIVRRKESRY